MGQRTLDLEPLVEINKLAARQHRPDRLDHRLGQMGEVAEVLVAHLAALPIGAPQQLRDVDPAALPLRPDCGYVNCTTTLRHTETIAHPSDSTTHDFGYTTPPKKRPLQLYRAKSSLNGSKTSG